MKFEWDDIKSEQNVKKHGVSFEEAQTVFLDPNAIEFYDNEHSKAEDRFVRLGISLKGNILTVVFCEIINTAIRIISARKATSKERMIYEERI